MTYPKGGGHNEVRTDTLAGSGSLFCCAWMDGSDGKNRVVVYVAMESDAENKFLRYNNVENVPADKHEYKIIIVDDCKQKNYM